MAAHHPPPRWLLVLVALSVLVGCGGGEEPAAPTTTEATGASASEAASVVAQHRAALVKAIEFEGTCFTLECMTAANIVTRWHRIADMADTLKGALIAREPVVSEVRPLVEDTKASIDKVIVARRGFDACTNSTGNLSGCGTEQSAFEQAFRALVPQLAAWDPYL
jgi:hypothetical protein